ncbi:neurogenic locus notch homolog protein 1-like [Dreissena polymorpha]|uniref:neurogenic locus notch homolog protein 1-like n=1 Tax=Dreissena polymorpha TaxID=45954 RepID=UPI002264B936|nr:neurogenic locus notch homolog protein 1-like [Dreissena polymorpha]
MVGSLTLICQTRPRWNDTESTCVGDCGDLARPTNGDVSYTDTIVNSRAANTCTDGFRLSVIDACEGVTCMNGAKCMAATGGYKCVCPTGYTGPFCETDIDECNPNPCIHGSCAETRLGDLTCTCKVGYTGNTCDEEINECIPDPCEHGTCKDLLADYECACQAGYTGKDCSKDIDECFSSPCEHGTCVNLVNSYKCRCDVGYSGANCNQDINDCVNHLCSNGAICIDQVGDYTCKCTAGFSGKYCDDNCPEPVVPENGLLNTSEGLGVGNTIYYSCKDGYELVGKAQRTCGTTSTWSGTEPTCLIQCPILEPITNGDVDMSLGRHEGSQATYFCENNYALIGYPVMTCESSGVWGGKKPGCVFAMFPDTLLAFGVVLIILAIVDVFVLAICVYYKFCRKKPPQTPSKPYPDDLFADGEGAVPPRDSTMPPFSRKQKFSKVTPDDDHPPPHSVDEPNVVYRSTMKMNDKVLDTIFSKGSKYRRQIEAEERTPYLDDDVINDKGYNTENSNSNEDAHSEVFDKHLDLTHPSPGPQKSPREKRKQEEPEEEEEEDEGRFRFRLRGPPPSITDSLFKEKETSLTADEKRRSKSALPSYRLQQKNVLK